MWKSAARTKKLHSAYRIHIKNRRQNRFTVTIRHVFFRAKLHAIWHAQWSLLPCRRRRPKANAHTLWGLDGRPKWAACACTVAQMNIHYNTGDSKANNLQDRTVAKYGDALKKLYLKDETMYFWGLTFMLVINVICSLDEIVESWSSRWWLDQVFSSARCKNSIGSDRFEFIKINNNWYLCFVYSFKLV